MEPTFVYSMPVLPSINVQMMFPFPQTMVQQLRECVFKDLQMTTKRDVHTLCTIIERSTCVSVVEIFVTLPLESLHFQ